MGWQERSQPRGRNWMTAMGVLFLVAAGIIAIRNLVLYYVDSSVGLIENGTQQFLYNYVNAEINNEKFVMAMIAGGTALILWGYFKKKDDYGPPDEHERRRFGK